MRKRLLMSTAGAIGALMVFSTSAAAEPAPGSPGIGDPYYAHYGNGGYDVSHYDLRLRYTPKTDKLQGTATILATTTQELSRFNLDLGLDTSSVLVNNRTATFKKTEEHELEVTPSQPLAKDQKITVVVRYSGIPSQVKIGGLTAWLRTPDGGVAAGEPEIANWWFPGNDHPRDKATFDVSVSVPNDGTKVLSNGIQGQSVPEPGRIRYAWRSHKPQATYLATLAIGKFEVTEDKTASGIPVVNFYSPDIGEFYNAAKASVERTREVVEWAETVFGPYPFEAAGGYVPNTTPSFALETQTRSYYSPRAFRRGSNVSVVVHENAHQWYGDSVSIKNWRDIWLNEGFARYSQWLWSEKEDEGTAQEWADFIYDSNPADSDFWKVKPGDPGARNEFHASVYDRGALTVQVLRNAIGDKAFFEILKGWPQERKYGTAAIEDFIAYAEKVSGKELDALFQTWLFTAGRPSKPAAAKVGLKHGGKIKRPRSFKQVTQAVHEH